VSYTHPIQSTRSVFAMTVIIAIAVGLLVWHATRANQARLGIRTRRGQIKSMWREIRAFVLRGIVLLIVLIILVAVALKHFSFP
jgi:hypothetical protein